MTDYIKFFQSINKLKDIKRTGWIESGIESAESVAEHIWRTAMMVMVLAPDELDKDRAIKIALIHELGEVGAGDITPHDPNYIGKEIIERETIQDFLPMLEDREIYDLWDEYAAQKTPESLFVKQCDILEMIFQAKEYEKSQGGNIKRERWDFWEYADQRIKDPIIKNIYDELK